jgi:hypothetical protein
MRDRFRAPILFVLASLQKTNSRRVSAMTDHPLSRPRRALVGSLLFSALGALALTASPATAQGSGAPAKQPGVIRIGLVKPKVSLAAGDAAQMAETVRQTFTEFLAGPSREVVLLTSRAPSQVLEEARMLDCDYTVSATLTHTSGGSGGGLIGNVLRNAASTAGSTYMPNVNPITSAAANTALQTAADYAGNVRARDEVRIEYSLLSTKGKSPLIDKKAKAKAGSDGEDIITPLIETAAETLATSMP